MMTRTEQIGDCTLHLGDCREILPTLGKVDAVVTDPPYPDFYVEEYKYRDDGIDFLGSLACRQFVFWSGDMPFPLPYSAAHIWHKNPSNCGAQYEKILERNGNKQRMVFTHYMVNSTVAASFARDVYTGHPSQKPIGLIKELVEMSNAQTILDPFMGSGTTGVACVKLGRKFIGIEISEEYFDIACKRIEKAYAQPDFLVNMDRESVLETQEEMQL